MSSLNRLFIIGNIVRDAELKNVTVNGESVPRCRFVVAVNETRANGEPIVTYFETTLWREPAVRLSQWLLKGRKVHVEGNVRLNQYVDANHIVRTSMQIHNPTVTFLCKKPEEQKGGEEPAEVDVSALEDFDEDDLPFN